MSGPLGNGARVRLLALPALEGTAILIANGVAWVAFDALQTIDGEDAYTKVRDGAIEVIEIEHDVRPVSESRALGVTPLDQVVDTINLASQR